MTPGDISLCLYDGRTFFFINERDGLKYKKNFCIWREWTDDI